MKLMIASDIHGSAYYCRKLIEAYNREQPEKLLLLGDILYHGPRNDLPKEYAPKEVIEMLNEISENLICVRGNCDTEVDQMVLNFEVLADYAYLYVDGFTFFATHGHKFNEQNPPKLKKGNILLNGHTHVPKFEKYDNFTYVNCGSVSIPKENSPHSYIIFENGIFFYKELDGHIYRLKTLRSESSPMKIRFDKLSERDLFEAEHREYLENLEVELGCRKIFVNVYTLARLSQDFRIETENCGYYVPCRNLLFVEEVTPKKIEAALEGIYKEGYFDGQ